jgi:hypothetical protein
VGEEPGVLAGDALPGRHGLRVGAQPFVLLADPPHQVGVDAGEERTQRGAVERPVVLDPAANDRVDLLREFGDGEGNLAVQPPPTDLTADLVEGLLADRGQGRNEVNFTPALDRAARAWNVYPRKVNEVCS